MDTVTILSNLPTAIAVVVVVYILGRAWLEIQKIKANTEAVKADVQAKEAAAKLAATELETAARIKATELESAAKIKASELESETAKVRAEAERLRGEREEKLAQAAQQTAILQVQQTAALAAIVGAQKQTTTTVAKSLGGIGKQVEGAATDMMAAVDKLRALITTGFELLATDSKAFYSRSDRAMQALLEGDVEKAKGIAAEQAPEGLTQ